MTERTTRIWVDLTDGQMDKHPKSEWISSASKALYQAIEAQRPRPIAVGDRVTPNGGVLVLDVEAVKDGAAWLWRDGYHYDTRSLAELTRVDDEATA